MSPYITLRARINSAIVLPCLVEMRGKRCSEMPGVQEWLLQPCTVHVVSVGTEESAPRQPLAASPRRAPCPSGAVLNGFTRHTTHLAAPRTAKIKFTPN